ncbi:interleukin-12 receptor subunit beta-1 isoform X2 [Kryptolebias marmoratus]|uniref:interleukin-12 receptor subunit beta-1 isoform X2 n=1 Tax=Kryptolebias marmoratus TaxID=37003 RepID=UPI0007F916A6|nr:interleukin-12 receptor subunit beta-1 isoform X2 [Kryptolebias marmoratus]
METFDHLRSPHGFVLFTLLATISKGLACEAPSSPQCFRRNEEESVYICEWGFDTNESDVTFDLYFHDIIGSVSKFMNLKKNRTEIIEEKLTVGYKIDFWVDARAGNSSCTSPRRSGVLVDSVKYDAPQNISVFWSGNNLSLSWLAAEEHPALAEVWFRQYEHPTESWEKRLINTTDEASMYKVIVVNLLKNSAYQIQIRHQSMKAKNSLWSSWSPVIIVPAELEHKPEVSSKIKFVSHTRQVTLTWKSAPRAATLSGVKYRLNDTQSSRGCPCKKKSRETSTNSYTFYVSYSAVNITVIARNAAGESPQAIIQVPAASAADLKICDKSLLNKTIKKRTCLEFYELQDADLKPESVMTLTARKQKKEKQKINKTMKDFTRYLYFEHRCDDGKPQKVKMCLFYKKEGVPNKEPKDFAVVAETQNSASLSWKGISHEHLRGFLTHYNLCSVKISSQDGKKECFNVSASATKHHLKGLTPGTKYNISLAGVTQAGEGPLATQTITTSPEKPINVWLSFGLLLAFFLLSTCCTVVLKRIKSKIFPPVPIPVIQDFTPRPPESEQEMWERKEEVHELTLHQIVSEQKSVSEETSSFRREWVDRTDERSEAERTDSTRSDDERSSLDSAGQMLRRTQMTEPERVENELAMLIYKNGLVFDEKSESPNQSDC